MAIYARAGEGEAGTAGVEASDLKDQRCGAVGILRPFPGRRRGNRAWRAGRRPERRRASSGVETIGAPVWKRDPGRDARAGREREHRGRPAWCRRRGRQRWRAAPASKRRRRGDGGGKLDDAARAATTPSSTPRKTDCDVEDRVGEAAAERLGRDHPSSPRTRVKKLTRVAAVLRRVCGILGGDALADRRDDADLDDVAIAAALPERVELRDHQRARRVAAEDMAEADLAAVDPHHGAGHGHLAEIEGRAAAADPAAGHDQAGLGRADGLERRRLGEAVEGGGHLAELRQGEHREGRAPGLGRCGVVHRRSSSTGCASSGFDDGDPSGPSLTL